MSTTPHWLDYAYGENAALSLVRGLRGPSARWGELVGIAQTAISYYQETPFGECLQLFDEESSRPLVAASRILDSASQLQSQVTESHKAQLRLMAAVAYAMYGNFPSAYAVVQRGRNEVVSSDPLATVAVATICPRLVGEMIGECSDNQLASEYLAVLARFLQTGDSTLSDRLHELLGKCVLSADTPFIGAALRSTRIALQQVLTLSVARVLGNNPLLEREYVQRLIDKGVAVFLPPQFRAVARGLVSSGTNALIALPTSTGKTLLGELCIAAAVARAPGLACYIAPYVDLGRQVAESLKSHLPNGIRIHTLLGGFREAEPISPTDQSEVVVATPERFDALLRINPEALENLKIVVVDEAHLVQDGSRGVKLEGTLTRLRMRQGSGDGFRLVLLSAVLSQYHKLCAWLAVANEDVVVDDWKPTARRLAIWQSNGTLAWYVGDEALRQEGQSSTSVIGVSHLPWPQSNVYPTGQFGGMRSQEDKVHDNVAFLVSALYEQYREQLLCACATKHTTRRLAASISARFADLEFVPKNVGRAIQQIERHHRFLLPLCRLLRKGIAYHNASVPHEIRRIIVDAIQARELRAVTATTTLAEGIDLPFRFTVLADWLTYQGEAQPRPISGLLFRNIAGRCGRAGVFTEGDTIVFDNPLGDLQYTGPHVRSQVQRDTLLSETPPELASQLEDARTYQPASPNGAELASQLLASVSENPTEDDLADAFTKHTYAAQRLESTAALKNCLSSIISDLLSDNGGALATAASPLTLTAFGEAANRTGFSPGSCRRIVTFLASSLDEVGVVPISRIILETFSDAPEQSNLPLRKMMGPKSTRFCIKPEDLEMLLSNWLQGETLEDMFVLLPFVRRSRRKARIEDWVAGNDAGDAWNQEFDKFADFLWSVLSGFLPWFLRACGRLAEHVDGWATTAAWGDWAEFLEHGVNNTWAVAAIKASAPGSRKTLVVVGELWPDNPLFEIDDLGLNLIRAATTRQFVEDALSAASNRQDMEHLMDELERLRAWLWARAGVQ